MAKTKYQPDRLSGDYEVVKNNKLIEAKYRVSLSEQKLILTLCSKIQSDDISFKEFELDAAEFFELLGVTYGGSRYDTLKNACKKLASRVLSIDTGDGFRIFPWMHHVEYKKNEGKVLLQFNDLLAPYLLYIKNNIYTKYKLGIVLQFKSEYSIRIYELTKQYIKAKERVISVEELRNILCLEKNEYSRFSDLKRFIIDQAQKEINDKSDIEIKVEPIKNGRKVVSLYFTITENWKNVSPIENWFDYQKYKSKSTEELAEIFCDVLKEKYRVDISVNAVHMFSHRALLSTIFELKEGYYKEYDIKNPALYFMKVLVNKTNDDEK